MSRASGGGSVRRQRVAAWIGILGAVLLPVALLLSHRNLTIVLALMGLAGMVAPGPWRAARWAWPVLALLGWTAASAFWSPYQAAGDWPFYMLALGLVGVGLSRLRSERVAIMVSWAGAVALLLLGFEAVSGGLIRDVLPPEARPDKDLVAAARGVGSALYLLPGVLMFLTARRLWWLAGLVLVASGVGAASFGITANAVALSGAAACAAIGYGMRGRGLQLLCLTACLGFVAMPILASALPPVETMAGWTEGPISWRQRLLIWRTVWSETTGDLLAYLIGHGVEAVRVLGETAGSVTFPDAGGPSYLVPTHPHDVFLQIAYDLGLVGVALSIWALVAAGRRLSVVADARRAAAGAGVIGVGLVFAGIDASLWTLWRVAAPMLGVWLILALPQSGDEAHPAR